MQHSQPALPLIHRDGERITIPRQTVIVATTDPDKPRYVPGASSAPVVAIVRQPDGTEWVWWQAKGGYVRAAVLVDGRLPVVVQPRERKSRPKIVLPPRWCERCGELLPAAKPAFARYCSHACAAAASRARHDAKYGPRRSCSVRGCQRKHAALGYCVLHYPSSDMARARHRGAVYEVFARTDVYDRDGWICGICSEPVDRKLKAPDLMRVSLDHIIPFARGGDHTFDNTQCSHLICNIRKGSKLPILASPGASASLRVERSES